MHLAEIVTKRPVAVIMFYLGILLLGAVSLSKLSVDLLPDLSYPKLTIRTTYTDAVPEEVERIVTKPIEQIVATVPGIRKIQSISREGISLVTIEFNWGRNMDFASLHVREKLDRLGKILPREAGKPTIIRLDPNSQPIMALSVSGKDLVSLKELSRDVFKRRMEQIQGVALAEVVGGLEKEIHVIVDKEKLEMLALSINDISRAIGSANIDLPGGTLIKGRYRYSLRTLGAFQKPKDIEKVVIKYTNTPIILKDVATVQEGFKERKNITHYNGAESIGIFLYKEAGSNTVRVSHRVRQVISQLKKEYPEVPIVIAFDQASFISRAITNVLQAILIGGILAFLILFFFLHELRNPVIIAISMPISIIATFILLYFTHVSLNLMSLGGLAMGVGMLVDSSIVVLENIFRHREEGKPILEASVAGTREVAMAVTASTFTTVAVFLPVLYVKGVAGQLFRDQALTVTFALTASLFVSLTLLPVLTSRFFGSHSQYLPEDKSLLAPKESSFFQKPFFYWIIFPFKMISSWLLRAAKWTFHNLVKLCKNFRRILSYYLRYLTIPIFKWFDKVLSFLMSKYERFLIRALNHRLIAVGITFLLFLATLLVALHLPRELMPGVDQKEFSIKISMPPGTSLIGTEEIVTNIESKILNEKAIRDVFSSIGMIQQQTGTQLEQSRLNRAEIRVRIKKGFSTNKIIKQLRRRLLLPPDAKVTFSSGETVLSQILGTAKSDIIIKIIGENTEEMKRVLKQVKNQCKTISALTDLKTDYEEGRPEYRIIIDRKTASQYGLSVTQIANFLRDNLSGSIASQFKEFDRKIDIRVRPQLEERNTLNKILNTIIPVGKSGVPVREVVHVSLRRGPTEIHRENQARTISLYANVSGKSLGRTIQKIEKKLSLINTPPETRITVGGAREEMSASYKSLIAAGILAIALVYMIMAAQFESLLHPLVIIFSVPMAAIGTTWLLLFTGQSLNVISLIGIVVLIGIAVNDAIVKIDFINKERQSGKSVRDAIIEAGRKRFRPIVMTSVTTILGLLPLAIGLGAGAELQRPLAIAIIGGLITSTFLTLVMIPVIYSFTVKTGNL